MENFITPPGHIDFQAKMLAANVDAEILDLAVAYVKPNGGGPAPSHTHEKDHFFIVAEGCATIKAGDETIVLNTDETAYINGRLEHSVWNKSDKLLKIIKINLRHK